ncbi:hypothetical protein COU95_02530 [Candidatus Shapirobacteria bacterium CG10_big_fil_rev_8_21_14_0_10_40_9]|uniref:Uncharacterized protein n=1 Tax=Candidatus Shapirobacteria bacterium CG10_big_fil_rev_8_21_14_0_10_40_9 TaxID=1974888 RepID=A0A2M8L3C1_9BACT|nr:MAG: hypothetical protein COU95_02530 [Candidatus Shapirobacteria bacterium CG10_big_fil_rev_8_21_14_0_10_40_9]
MIKHIWSVLCRKTVIDDETNNISLFDVFEQLGVNASTSEKKDIQINVPINFELVSLWVKTTGGKTLRASIEVEVIDPEAKRLKSFIQNLEFSTNIKRMRSRLRIMGLSLTTSGDYIFRVKIKEENQKEYITVAELPLEVNLNKKIKLEKENQIIN